MSALSPAMRRSWQDNGFLVLPGFYTEAEISAVSAAYARVWTDLPADVVVDTTGDTRRRIRASDLTEAERKQSFKVNDLYLTDQRVREVALAERLVPVLGELLGDQPVVCNTLSLEFGSQQVEHLDTLFMTPQTDGALVATWMALEDVHPDAGPLRYYPESNHIEPYRFSTGSFHVYQPEMEAWGDYMAREVQRHGLAESRFLARAGDLFIWNAWLLHGGAEICQTGLTRNSLVTHYFTAADSRALGCDLRPGRGGGYWMRRPPQPVPTDQPPEPAAPVGIRHRVRELRDRLDAVRHLRD